jgi:hypothetical protein
LISTEKSSYIPSFLSTDSLQLFSDEILAVIISISKMVVYCYHSNNQNDPELSSFPFYVPNMQLMLSVGSYVILNGEGITNNQLLNRNGKIIARVMSVDHCHGIILCSVLVLLSSVISTANVQIGHQQYINPFTTGIAAGVPEVTNCLYKVIASTADIEDVAFVFHITDFLNGRVYGQGISNCFLLRYNYSINNTLIPLEYVSCFPSSYVDHCFFPVYSFYIVEANFMSSRIIMEST